MTTSSSAQPGSRATSELWVNKGIYRPPHFSAGIRGVALLCGGLVMDAFLLLGAEEMGIVRQATLMDAGLRARKASQTPRTERKPKQVTPRLHQTVDGLKALHTLPC